MTSTLSPRSNSPVSKKQALSALEHRLARERHARNAVKAEAKHNLHKPATVALDHMLHPELDELDLSSPSSPIKNTPSSSPIRKASPFRRTRTSLRTLARSLDEPSPIATKPVRLSDPLRARAAALYARHTEVHDPPLVTPSAGAITSPSSPCLNTRRLQCEISLGRNQTTSHASAAPKNTPSPTHSGHHPYQSTASVKSPQHTVPRRSPRRRPASPVRRSEQEKQHAAGPPEPRASEISDLSGMGYVLERMSQFEKCWGDKSGCGGAGSMPVAPSRKQCEPTRRPDGGGTEPEVRRLQMQLEREQHARTTDRERVRKQMAEIRVRMAESEHLRKVEVGVLQSQLADAHLLIRKREESGHVETAVARDVEMAEALRVENDMCTAEAIALRQQVSVLEQRDKESERKLKDAHEKLRYATDALVRLKNQNQLLLRNASQLAGKPQPAATQVLRSGSSAEEQSVSSKPVTTRESERAADIEAAMAHVKQLKQRSSLYHSHLVAV